MNDSSKITVVHAEAYNNLDLEDLSSGVHGKSFGARKTWLAAFTKKHLPASRLRSNDDDLSSKFESIDCSRRKKKKRRKSKASVAGETRTRLLRNSQRHFKLSPDLRYETYLPLMKMWTKYMEELIPFSNLTDSSLPNVAQKMMKADFHGCPLIVRKSKCPSYIGVQGIVLQETRNTFVLVTPDNVVKRIPKANSIFNVILHDHIFTIYGNQFTIKPGERAAKKFKSKPSIDL
uniref:Ribonuclease P protein subunit p29 n=1 Tax=Arion vulgaris TaxID=1028688 RepID=A0A0B7AC97_9EUPU